MMAPETDDFLSETEGRELAQAGTRHAVKCDFCSSTIHPNTRITHYATEWKFPYGASGDVLLDRLYCGECDRHRIRMPLSGADEVLFSHRMTKDRTLVDWDIRDISPSDEGTPWSPAEIVDAVFPGSDVHISDIDPYASPESVADFFIYHGIDPRDIIAADGSTKRAHLAKARTQILREVSPGGERA